MSIRHAIAADPQALREQLSRLPGVTTARELFSGPEPLPVDGRLAPVFARGGLPRGEILSVTGTLALSFACAAAARATREQHWCAAVDTPELAVAGLADLGIDLEHFVHIGTPPQDWQRVVSILLETFDLLIVAPPAAPSPQQRQRLAAKVRERRASLIALGPLPGSTERCEVSAADWSGLRCGTGRLQTCTARVRHPRTGEHLLTLPTASGPVGLPAPPAAPSSPALPAPPAAPEAARTAAATGTSGTARGRIQVVDGGR